MYTLMIGVGNCGRNLVINTIREIFKPTKPMFSGKAFVRKFVSKGRLRGCYVFDLADISIPSDIMYLVRSRRIVFQPYKIRTVLGAGVGGRWWEAEKEAEENVSPKIGQLMKSELERVENVMILHSGGGGTGAGAGPVIADKINKYYRSQIKWLSGIVVLPHEDENMRKTNALCTIGRYLGKADSVIIVDNKRWHVIADNLKIPKEETHALDVINKVISRFYLWLNSTDPTLNRSGFHEVLPKDYEAADYLTIARYPEKETSLLVPFYAEYDYKELRKGYSILFLVLKTIFKYSLVDVDFSQPIYNIFIIVGIPLSIKNKYKSIISEQIEMLDNYIHEIIRVKNTLSVIKVFYQASNEKIVITGFMTAPYITRLLDLYAEVRRYLNLNHPYKDEELEHIERGLELFTEISDYMSKIQ